MRRKSRILGWLTVTALLLTSGLALSEREQERPLLLGGPLPQKQREIRLDPHLPSGALRSFAERPAHDPQQSACSFKRPVCVHGAPGVDAKVILGALEAMESAYQRLVIALGAPPPPSDVGRGGSDALDLYLVQDESELTVELDAQHSLGFDQGSSFCRVGTAESASGASTLARNATLCLGEAIGRGLDAGATPHVLRAFATHLWWATGNPTSHDVQAIDDLQSRPERAPLRREQGLLSEGAAAWFDVLEAMRGTGTPAGLARGLLTLSASSTEAGRLLWNNEPDVVDVVRHTLREDPTRVAHLMNDWAIKRAFMGSRDDGSHLPSLAFAGDFARVRFDWVMRYSKLPRRVAATRPIEPTGSIYLLLELDDVALGATLGFQAEWEAPVSFVWSLVQVDAKGHEMSRLVVPFKERATQTEQRLMNFEGASYVLLVGTNLGGVDRDHPFDPDVFPYEPHQCTVYLARL